jgi:hypothetical protein
MNLRQRLVPILKKWLKIDDYALKPTGFNGPFRYIRDVYCHHPRQRFLNFIEVRFKTMLGLWKIMSIPDSVLHRVFYVCLAKSAKGIEVIKLPIGNNENSCALLESLSSAEAFEKYRRVLQNSKLDPWLKNHCVAVTRVRRDGGYTSEFVDGLNLANIRDQVLRGEKIAKPLRQELTRAIDQLLQDLTGYANQHGTLIGDWPFHNLIFSPERQTIVNVDAEGFYTWFGAAEQSHLPLITANCLDFVQLLELVDSHAPDDAKIFDVLKMLDEVRRSEQQYNGRYFLTGYHSLELKGRKFRGQRECSARLAEVPFDFQNKVILDLGCNSGGMLHALSKTIQVGRGVDFNPNCVNAANLIKTLNQSTNLEFYTFDLDRDDLSRLKNFLPGETADICFLLSLCIWLRRWPDVVRAASTLAKNLLFESNGTVEQQQEQGVLLRRLYKRVQPLADSSPDDFIHRARKLYLCSNE